MKTICGCSTDNTLGSEVIRFVFVVTVENKILFWFRFVWTIVLWSVSVFIALVLVLLLVSLSLRPHDLFEIVLLDQIVWLFISKMIYTERVGCIRTPNALDLFIKTFTIMLLWILDIRKWCFFSCICYLECRIK